MAVLFRYILFLPWALKLDDVPSTSRISGLLGHSPGSVPASWCRPMAGTPETSLTTVALLNWFVWNGRIKRFARNGCIGGYATCARFPHARPKWGVLTEGRLHLRSPSPDPKAPHQSDGPRQPNGPHRPYHCQNLITSFGSSTPTADHRTTEWRRRL